jgi:hypothetical protein
VARLARPDIALQVVIVEAGVSDTGTTASGVLSTTSIYMSSCRKVTCPHERARRTCAYRPSNSCDRFRSAPATHSRYLESVGPKHSGRTLRRTVIPASSNRFCCDMTPPSFALPSRY